MLIHNARFAGHDKPGAWVLIEGDRIAAIGTDPDAMPQSNDTFDAEGALLMPGAIDCHVHFREPGLEQKADMASESRAAVAGGVTSIIDMPNTKPQTTSLKAWQDKCDRAAAKCLCNYAFFIGATDSNLEELKQADYTKCPGVKLFMGASTGNMLVSNSALITNIMEQVPAIVAVHAEDQDLISLNTISAKKQYGDGEVPVKEHSNIRSSQACVKSTLMAMAMALLCNRRLHICHVSTAEEASLIAKAKKRTSLITAEVSPHHLLWCSDNYARKGTRIKMNPAVKTRDDSLALRQALKEGTIDMVATDHAPHLLSDKEGDALTATSGAPMVQFSLPAMLALFPEADVQKYMCANPAKVYGIEGRGLLQPGCYADIVLVKETEPYTVADADVVSKCAWTPMAGEHLHHRVTATWVNGALAYIDGRFAEAPSSMPLQFNHKS